MSYIRRKTLKSGRYAYYPVLVQDGREVYLGGYKLKKDAEARLARETRERAAGKSDDITFAVFADQWLDFKRTKVKTRTANDYGLDIDKHLRPAFGDYLLRHITPAQIDRFVSQIKGSPRTANKQLVLLRSMLNQAKKWRYISDNPTDLCSKMRQPREEMRFLSPPEVVKLLEKAGENRTLFATAIFTGLREGELLALKGRDIDLKNGVIHVRRSWSQEQGFVEPKTRASRRTVSAPPDLLPLLCGRARDELIFPSKRGTPIDRHNLLEKRFYPALKAAKLHKVRFHDLRHTYATLMISMNVNVKWLQQQMGHASIATTLDLYGHLLHNVEEESGPRLWSLVFGESRESGGNDGDEKESA